jgi:hypothetical protein
MNMNLIAGLFVVGVVVLAVLVGVWQANRREHPLTVLQRAERAEANGLELWRVAQQMRASALEEQRTSRRDQLLLWARQCERAATDHLACINAISMDSLHAVGLKEPVHLGDFKGSGNRRRNPGPMAMSRILLRGGRRG